MNTATPPPFWKKWLRFSLLQLLVCALVSSAFLYFGIWIGGRVHQQRAAEEIQRITTETDAEVKRQRQKILDDLEHGFHNVEKSLALACYAVAGDDNPEFDKMRQYGTLESNALQDGSAFKLPRVGTARAWIAVFKRFPNDANTSRLDFLASCLNKRQSWKTPHEAWKSFVSDTRGNLLPLYWYACDDPSLVDMLNAKVKNRNEVEMAQASRFLSWFFTCMSNPQRADYASTLYHFRFPEKDLNSVWPWDAPFYVDISRPAGLLQGRLFRLDRSSTLTVHLDDEVLATLPGTEGSHFGRNADTGVLKSVKPGPHKCRLVFSGTVLGGELLGQKYVLD